MEIMFKVLADHPSVRHNEDALDWYRWNCLQTIFPRPRLIVVE